VGGAVAIAVLIALHPWRARLLTPEERRANAARLQTVLRSARMDPQDMDFMYGQVRAILLSHGLTITHPVNTFWVAEEEIRKKQGPDTHGYTEAMRFSDGTVTALDLFVPRDGPPVATLHTMAHELGHCWQHDNHLDPKDAARREGFCEWVAWHALEDVGRVSDPSIKDALLQESLRIRLNGYKEYSEGFVHFAALEKASGSNAVFAEMLAAP
jgi:hypothetical protein